MGTRPVRVAGWRRAAAVVPPTTPLCYIIKIETYDPLSRLIGRLAYGNPSA